MEKKEIKRVLERIYRFLKDNKGRFYVDDCETVTLYEGMSEIIDQELDKAREGGFFDETELLYLMMLLQNDNAKGRDTERPNKTAKEKISKLLKQ